MPQNTLAKQALRTEIWRRLEDHFQEVRDLHLRDLFAEDLYRFEKLSLQFPEILVDFSKNRITEHTLELLIELAEAAGVMEIRDAMYRGEKINWTENRAVLHIALRNRSPVKPLPEPIFYDGKDVMPEINAVLDRMRDFSEKFRSGGMLGFSGKRLTNIVHIGIGGSYLGPAMIYQALTPYVQEGLRVYFVSNIDGADFITQTNGLNPAETLFVIASKTFTTQETITNALTARNWLLKQTGWPDQSVRYHFAALSVNREAVEQFGIDLKNMFEFWDWVGGRYSWCSSISLAIVCAIGFKRFEELLYGAFMMDQHFKLMPLRQNIPVILALIGVWYNNFFKAESYTVLPYCQLLAKFPAFLQQCDMESNGKSVDKDGNHVHYQTGPIVWGEPGTNGQHAFYQLIHQGTKLIPADFIGCIHSHYEIGEHHQKLMAHFFAQPEAMMKGKSEAEINAELTSQGLSADAIAAILPHKRFSGNRPANSILLHRLTPKTLGSLIALYEMKIFVQGIIWRINSFDQWGVELGKLLADRIITETEQLLSGNPVSLSAHDSSTAGLINYYINSRHGL